MAQSIQQIENQIAQLRNNLKIAVSYARLEEIFSDRSKYTFTSISNNDVTLFSQEEIWSCGKFDISADRIKHYLDMHIISYDVPSPHIKIAKEAIKIVKFLKSEEERDGFNFHNIL